MNIYNKAYSRAIEAHGGQMYGDLPYGEGHLLQVVETLIRFGFDDEEWIDSGWLHDSVEDTELTIEEVRAEFGETVGDLVWAVTGIGHNRKTRVADMHHKVAKYPRAAILKAADRIVNKRNSKMNKPGLYKTYLKEDAEFGPLVRDKIPAAMYEELMSI